MSLTESGLSPVKEITPGKQGGCRSAKKFRNVILIDSDMTLPCLDSLSHLDISYQITPKSHIITNINTLATHEIKNRCFTINTMELLCVFSSVQLP